MAKLKILAGDFPKGEAAVISGQIVLPQEPGQGFFSKLKTVAVADLAEVAIATEENVTRLGGALGWGVAGGAILGPVGLLAGLLLGGKKTEVTFVARFKDGGKMLASTDSKTYQALSAATFK